MVLLSCICGPFLSFESFVLFLYIERKISKNAVLFELWWNGLSTNTIVVKNTTQSSPNFKVVFIVSMNDPVDVVSQFIKR